MKHQRTVLFLALFLVTSVAAFNANPTFQTRKEVTSSVFAGNDDYFLSPEASSMEPLLTQPTPLQRLTQGMVPTVMTISAAVLGSVLPAFAEGDSEVVLAELPPPYVPALFGVGLLAGVGLLTSSLGNVMDEGTYSTTFFVPHRGNGAIVWFFYGLVILVWFRVSHSVFSFVFLWTMSCLSL